MSHLRSNILFGVFLAYFGSYVHRPRMMALSSVLAVLGTAIMFLPHYVAEPYQYDGQILDDGEQKGIGVITKTTGVNRYLRKMDQYHRKVVHEVSD